MATDAQAATKPERFIRVATAAARLDCNPRLLRELIFAGELDAVRIGRHGHWRISTRSLDQLIARSRR